MSEVQRLGGVEFRGAFNFAFPKIKTLTIENLTCQGEWVEGDVVLKYDFNGDREVRQHFKTKLNEDYSFDVGPLEAKFRIWLEGPKLWLGLKLCLGLLCTDEMKTSVDIPQQ